MKIAALIVAGGRGTRIGGEVPKQYQPLLGRPLLHHTLSAFVRHPRISDIVTIIHPDDASHYQTAVEGLSDPRLRVALGGATRQASVRAGLLALENTGVDQVLIHDGARPCIETGLLDRIINALSTDKGVLPALPVTDTLRRDNAGSAGETISREGLVRAQTPQAFPFSAILRAHQRAPHEDYTDDVALAAEAGIETVLVEGSEDNIKVTHPEDFARVSRLFASGSENRTGFGYDVHRFSEGTHVTLGGVEIPHTHTLLGHSDADVALHALTDALLGAIGEGDIGDHFPPSDPQWKGAPSRIFLEHAARLVRSRGGEIANLDVTLVCEAPKIGPHRDAMRRSIADMISVDVDRISVKATTSEKLGFTGREEGIAAQAVASVRLPVTV